MGDMTNSMIVIPGQPAVDPSVAAELTVNEFSNILMEIQEQPAWRVNADVESDYYDGNQLDSDTLQAMKNLGMAPIVENLMAPTIDSVLGLEAKTRLDWKIAAQGDEKYAEVAEAMNFKMKEAETEAHADRACSDAFAAQMKAGIGWVEVAKEHDPFRYPYRVEAVHRNEMFWDFKGKRPDTSDWRWLVRKKWHDDDVLKLVFPKSADLIGYTAKGWGDPTIFIDGGVSTGLAMDYGRERGWSIEEQEWRDTYRKRLALCEVWYRRWVRGFVLKTPDGRVVEYKASNLQHVQAVAYGLIQPQPAIFTKVRLAWFIGPHKLADMPTPYKHDKFPYVPFFGKREDMTGVPYGLGRPMKHMQDEINARNTKMIWLLAAKRVTMTEGVTKDSPEVVRQEAARPDAVHVLNPQKLAQGGKFEVETDFQLNAQQYSALQDKRQSMKNVAGVYSSFEGSTKGNISGIAANTLVEQSTQTLAESMDNFQFGRRQVGELLMSLIIEDMGEQPQDVQIDNEINGNKTIKLNAMQQHPQTGEVVMNNDVQRARLRVALSDVPSTASYRSQRLMMLTEITKSLPPNLQGLVIDFVMAATDLPERAEIVKRLRKALNLGDQQPQTPEEAAAMQAQAQQAQEAAAVQKQALAIKLDGEQANNDKTKAETARINAQAANEAVETEQTAMLKELTAQVGALSEIVGQIGARIQ